MKVFFLENCCTRGNYRQRYKMLEVYRPNKRRRDDSWEDPIAKKIKRDDCLHNWTTSYECHDCGLIIYKYGLALDHHRDNHPECTAEEVDWMKIQCKNCNKSDCEVEIASRSCEESHTWIQNMFHFMFMTIN